MRSRSFRNTQARQLVGYGAILAVLVGPLPPASAVELIESDSAKRLSSVLVGTRSASPTDTVQDNSALAPISQISDFEPELADPPEENVSSPSFKEAEPASPTRSAATPAKPAESEPRVAARPVEPVMATPPKTTNGPIRQARFNRVLPGVTTEDELTVEWGKPVSRTIARGELSGQVLSYDQPPFELVEALVEDSVVQVVRVTLAKPSAISDLTRKLKLAAVEPVDVIDPKSGLLLGVSFPEKGLTLLAGRPTTPGPADIVKLVLEPLGSKAFTLRAENRPWRELDLRLADLERAIEIDANDAHAWWLKSLAHLDAGQAEAATNAAQEAAKLRPGSAAYRLASARALAAAGDQDQAVLTTRRVLDDLTASPLVRAEAFHTMGELASLGGSSIANKAIGFHTSAIEIADGLSDASDDRVRRASKRLLVDAHLAIAEEIARRDYADRGKLVADWVGRASGLAEAAIEREDGGLELRLRVASGALKALASMRPTKDPAAWIAEAQETAEQLLSDSDQELFRARVAWELGLAYQQAVRVEHTRGEASQALVYGSEAIEHLSEGAEPRVTAPLAESTVGQLYFYLGAVNAVHRQNHAEAVGWYTKARPLVESAQPSEFIVPRRTGEMMVSMGVSFWQEDDHDLAIELTEKGAQIMRQAIDAGVLENSALAVPYGNLAAMHKALGESNKAARYTKLAGAAKSGATKTATAVTEPAPPEPKANPLARRQSAVSRPMPQQQARRTTQPAPASQQAEAAQPSARPKRFARRPTPRSTMSR